MLCTSMLVHVSDDAADLSEVDEQELPGLDEQDEHEEEDDDDDDDYEEEEEEEGYAFPIGPLPQTVNNDLKSLDEMVRETFSLLPATLVIDQW